ncbi:MAG TPA: saccharopine dehydrogenase C-terminal domain-containing protein [Thermoanaerobaculia bacterium]|nr:saccharopine dehydrogenase C-terminal domain-containing protein [Thermoanaerobaculia bacterium]
MRMLVLGAGRMGLGAVHDLVSQPDVDGVTVADFDASKAEAIAARYPKARAAQIDCNDHAAVVDLMRGHASAISCVNYWLNERLARAAIEAGAHFCDLGGNNDVVDAELALDAEARAAGVNIIPDCGLAPGMVAVLVAHGASKFQKLDEVHIRVGGLPQDPKPPLDYQLVFSVEGLINEYIEPARVIRHGRIVTVESMTEIESLEFPQPFGTMEAFQTSGGTSTLVETFHGKVRELDYKTIRYPGHCEKFRMMIDLGLCSSNLLEVDGVRVKPRRVLGELLVKNLPHDEPDVVLVRVEFIGRSADGGGDGKSLRYDIIDRYDPATELSAMMRTTAFPASIVALMMARGQTTSKGALPQERCIPPDLFMDELAKRNIDVSISGF